MWKPRFLCSPIKHNNHRPLLIFDRLTAFLIVDDSGPAAIDPVVKGVALYFDPSSQLFNTANFSAATVSTVPQAQAWLKKLSRRKFHRPGVASGTFRTVLLTTVSEFFRHEGFVEVSKDFYLFFLFVFTPLSHS